MESHYDISFVSSQSVLSDIFVVTEQDYDLTQFSKAKKKKEYFTNRHMPNFCE